MIVVWGSNDSILVVKTNAGSIRALMNEALEDFLFTVTEGWQHRWVLRFMPAVSGL